MDEDLAHIRTAFIIAGLLMPDEQLCNRDIEIGRVHLAALRTPHMLALAIMGVLLPNRETPEPIAKRLDDLERACVALEVATGTEHFD